MLNIEVINKSVPQWLAHLDKEASFVFYFLSQKWMSGKENIFKGDFVNYFHLTLQ